MVKKCKKLNKKQIEFVNKLKQSKSKIDQWSYRQFKKSLKKENYCMRGIK